MRTCIVFLFAVCLTLSFAQADILQPWTTSETSLFNTTDSLPENVGSGWFDNNLVLNYGIWDGDSGGEARSTTGLLEDFIPTDSIGISFGANSNTQLSRIHVWVQKWTADDFIFQHGVITLQDNMDFSANANSLFSSGPDAVNHIDYSFDIPESTSGDITTVEFIFIEDMISAPFSKYSFAADGRGLAGTTTFSNVSWIISDGDSNPLPSPFDSNTNIIPLPSAVLLGTIGLGFSGWLCRKKQNKEERR